MGWPRDTETFPEPTWWNGGPGEVPGDAEPAVTECDSCGKPFDFDPYWHKKGSRVICDRCQELGWPFGREYEPEGNDNA